jgi:hypothetical protein
MCLHSISIDSLSSMLWYFNVYFMIKTVVLPVRCFPKLCENSHCMTISIPGTLDFQKWREREGERPNSLRVGLLRRLSRQWLEAKSNAARERRPTGRSPYRNRLRNDSAPPASGGASVARTETTGDLKNRGAEQGGYSASSPGDFSRSSRSARPAGKAPFSSSWALLQQQQQ